MTVLVMYSDSNYYYITSDGRNTGDFDIHSDQSVKVYGEEGYIYGQCGDCADELPFREIMAESGGDPWILLQLTRSENYRTMFVDFGSLVASATHGLYHVIREPHEDTTIEVDLDKRPKPFVMPLSDDDLPVYDGSGKYHVQGILAGVKRLTPEIVEGAIRKAYSVNHTIGGKIKTIKIKKPKRKPK